MNDKLTFPGEIENAEFSARFLPISSTFFLVMTVVFPQPIKMNWSPFARFWPGSDSKRGRQMGTIKDVVGSSHANGIASSTLMMPMSFFGDVPSIGRRRVLFQFINWSGGANVGLMGSAEPTLWPYLTFIVGTLVQSSQCRHQIECTGAVQLCPNGPECRCNVRDFPTHME